MEPSGSGYDDDVWYQSDAFHKPPSMLYNEEQKEVADEETEDAEFEFSLPPIDQHKSPTISADEIFHNGLIRPLFPVFFQTPDPPETTTDSNSNSNSARTKSIRLPLRELMLHSEQEMSCSSSESDDLEGASPETYCVWIQPDKEKSRSTGSSSKRWKLRDVVHGSHSDGVRESFVCSTPKQNQQQQHNQKEAHREHYLKNRAIREKDRKKSYLPYRQDVVGLFANVNGLSRAVQPF